MRHRRDVRQQRVRLPDWPEGLRQRRERAVRRFEHQRRRLRHVRHFVWHGRELPRGSVRALRRKPRSHDAGVVRRSAGLREHPHRRQQLRFVRPQVPIAGGLQRRRVPMRRRRVALRRRSRGAPLLPRPHEQPGELRRVRPRLHRTGCSARTASARAPREPTAAGPAPPPRACATRRRGRAGRRRAPRAPSRRMAAPRATARAAERSATAARPRSVRLQAAPARGAST